MPVRQRLFDNGVNTVTFTAAGTAPPPGLGATLAVTFDPFRSLEVERPGFGETVLTGGGIDVLAVQKRRENWYQDISRETFVAEFGARIAAYGRVLFYGSSAGAYAALYFARPFAAHVLAISPRASIHASYPSHERARARWGASFRHAPMAEGEDRTLGVALLYDPRLAGDALMGEDMRYLEQEILAAYPAARLLPIPYSGHPSAPMLADLGLLKPLLFGYLAEGRLPALRWHGRRRESWNHLMQLSRALLRHRRPAAAAALCDRALAMQPERGELFQLAAQIRQAVDDRPGAIAALRQAVALSPATVAARLKLVQMLRAEGGTEEAIALLREGLTLAPEQPQMRLWLPEMLRLRCERHMQEGAVETAQADARAALAMLDFDAAPGDLAEAQRHRSGLLAVLGRQEEALEAAAAACAAAPDRARYHTHHARLLLRAGQLPASRAAAETVVRLSPGHAASHRLLAEVLNRMKLTEQAVRSAEDALRCDPGNPRLEEFLALMLSKAGHVDEAVAVLERAIARGATQPSLLQAHRRLAAQQAQAQARGTAA
ncbi:tetratricopeptide repeat protein [Teichococcus aestuarii]|uniref:tetratricopeptide repeat protein n=2 Tax=Teichococcus aestuarii TaxID=568898 RepID=UPI00361FB28A